ncbi:MAG: aspartate aminotransferase family protein [Candidatus Sumerlaeia bacterium]|nr:aspartate aminotransferase family protein [Candidatus Sumerlaeia bacterium]
MSPSALDLVLGRERRHLIPCVHHFFGEEPLLLARGEGVWLFDEHGRRHLDLCSGISVMALGQADPDIAKAIATQTRRLQHACTVFVTEEYGLLAERLAQIAPGELTRSFFVNSGSEANEGALLLARLATGRRRFVSLTSSLHGRTHLTMSVTGLPMWRTDPHPSDCVEFAPSPLEDPVAEGVARAVEACGDDFAALIAEPIQGNGGIAVPPRDYFEHVARIVRAAGGLLIADEVQSGMGRSGRWFAVEHWGVTPDILTVAKALGGGTPLGAFITTDAIARAYTKPAGSTLGGNPVSCRAALAVIGAIERRGLLANARERGAQLMDGLRGLQAQHAAIGDVRGLGLMVGAEIVEPATREPDPAGLERLHRALRHRGFLCGKTGAHRNVLTFQPPLIITPSQIDSALEAIGACLTSSTADVGPAR